MTQISNIGPLTDCALRRSLDVIRQTHVQLHVPTEMVTASVLVSRIDLCDALLGEISNVRNSLAKDLKRALRSHPTLN